MRLLGFRKTRQWETPGGDLHIARATTTTTTTAVRRQIDMVMATTYHRARPTTPEATASAAQRNPTAIARKNSIRRTSVSAHQAHRLRTFRLLRPSSTVSMRHTGGSAAATTVVAEEGAVEVEEDAIEQRTRGISYRSPTAAPRRNRWRA